MNRGLPPASRRLAELAQQAQAQAQALRDAAQRCPSCGCVPSRPCAIVTDALEARCLPVGTFDLPTCSACLEAA